jgi:hypothetical protein
MRRPERLRLGRHRWSCRSGPGGCSRGRRGRATGGDCFGSHRCDVLDALVGGELAARSLRRPILVDEVAESALDAGLLVLDLDLRLSRGSRLARPPIAACRTTRRSSPISQNLVSRTLVSDGVSSAELVS